MVSNLKTKGQIALMARSGSILADILKKLVQAATPGIATKQLDDLAFQLCKEYEVKPAFYTYKGFPASLCVSVNDEVVHGIPGPRILQTGDLVSLDMGVIYKGWYSDSAVTIILKPEAQNLKLDDQRFKLLEVAREALRLGIQQARPGNHVGDIGHAVQSYVEKQGFGVVRDLVGHGIGKSLHERPHVPNYGSPGEEEVLREGMVICIEPMITAGDWHVATDKDNWTVRTKDGSLAAHFEHTVAVMKDVPQILTK